MSEKLRSLTSRAWRTTAIVSVLAAVALSSGAVMATPDEIVIDFESPAIEPGNFTTDYSALGAVGVSVLQAFGIVDDFAGDWDLVGDSGTQFLGANDASNFTIELGMDEPKDYFSASCARTSGSADGDTLAVAFFLDDVEVYDVGYTFGGVGQFLFVAVDLSLAGVEYDRVMLESSGSGFRSFGCDSLLIRPGVATDGGALPETGSSPAALVAWGAALLALGSLFARRRVLA